MRKNHKKTMEGKTDYGNMWYILYLVSKKYKFQNSCLWETINRYPIPIFSISLVRFIRSSMTMDELEKLKDMIDQMNLMERKIKKSPFYFVDLYRK